MKKKVIFGIRLQLYIGFLIPVILVVILGVVSYKTAADGMKKNYEESTSSSISTAMDYLDFGFETINAEIIQLYFDSSLSKYGMDYYDAATNMNVMKSTQSILASKQAANHFISAIYIIPKENKKCITARAITNDGFFSELVEEEPSYLESTKNSVWLGKHKFIDEKLGVKTDSYICSVIRTFSDKSAILVADIDSGAVETLLTNLGLGEGSIMAFITEDGRQLLVNNADEKMNEFSFIDTQYFTKANESDENTYSEYITIDGNSYLYLSARSAVNGSYICTIIPMSLVMEKTDDIQYVTIVMVIISCVTALLLGFIIVRGISKAMMFISQKLKIVSKGDLTVSIDYKKNNEFGVLAESIKDMVDNTRTLIIHVKETVNLVDSSVENVAATSNILEQYGRSITDAVTEIEKGITIQVDDSQNCLAQMDDLSKTIDSVSNDILVIEKLAGDTKEMITKGLSTMEELNMQSESAANITGRVMEDVSSLKIKSESIERFIGIINEIADQTNLLSLNASIEAARAGESGKGFSVVAEEIKKLADGSLRAANEITKVVQEIKMQTDGTVLTAQKAKDTVDGQSMTVKQTMDAFWNMNNSVGQLMIAQKQVSDSVENMDKKRIDTLTAVENISSVAEKTAESADVVNQSVKHQLTLVKDLKFASNELSFNMKELDEAVNLFDVNC